MPPAAAREEKLGPLHTVPRTAFPRPRQGVKSPAPPLSSRFWGHPRPRQEDCVPLLSSYEIFNCPWQKVLVIWQKREKRLWESNHLTITMLYLVILETEVVMGTATGRRTAMAVIMAIASKVFRSSKA